MITTRQSLMMIRFSVFIDKGAYSVIFSDKKDNHFCFFEEGCGNEILKEIVGIGHHQRGAAHVPHALVEKFAGSNSWCI